MTFFKTLDFAHEHIVFFSSHQDKYFQKWFVKFANAVEWSTHCLKAQKRTLATWAARAAKAAKSEIKECASTNVEGLYHQIVVIDLIAKEFSYYSICYNNFTKPASTSNTSNNNESEWKSKWFWRSEHIKLLTNCFNENVNRVIQQRTVISWKID